MRSYTAPHAPLSDYKHMQEVLGYKRSVIVQPSVYGADNQTTIEVCRDDPNMKAVIVIDDAISDDALSAFSEAGVVGCRVNMLFSSGVSFTNLRNLALRIADYGWHIQILADISNFDDINMLLRDVPVPIMFDHMGHMPIEKGVNHKSFQDFCKLLADGHIWTKLSGSYRVSSLPECNYEDVAVMVSELVSANPEQIVWGSDWPHPQISGPMPDDTALINNLLDWIPNQNNRQKIFADNAAKFYQFNEIL